LEVVKVEAAEDIAPVVGDEQVLAEARCSRRPSSWMPIEYCGANE